MMFNGALNGFPQNPPLDSSARANPLLHRTRQKVRVFAGDENQTKTPTQKDYFGNFAGHIRLAAFFNCLK